MNSLLNEKRLESYYGRRPLTPVISCDITYVPNNVDIIINFQTKSSFLHNA